MPRRFGPGRPSFPGFTGKLVVDTFRGAQRLRQWPKPRGVPKSSQVRIQNQRFKEAQYLAKRAPGLLQNMAISATQNTGLYPRDLLGQFIMNGMFELELPDGRIVTHFRKELFPVSWQGFIIRLDQVQVSPANTPHVITWPDPEEDPAGMFNAAEPTVVTIPEGVTRITLVAAFQGSGVISQDIQIRIAQISPLDRLEASQTIRGGRDLQVGTGPMVVEAGQQFEVRTFAAASETLQPYTTWFKGTILAAEPL